MQKDCGKFNQEELPVIIYFKRKAEILTEALLKSITDRSIIKEHS